MERIKIILLPLTFAICLMAGCAASTDEIEKYQRTQFKQITIDGCEYIYRDDGYKSGSTICHKGNCNNPIHKK